MYRLFVIIVLTFIARITLAQERPDSYSNGDVCVDVIHLAPELFTEANIISSGLRTLERHSEYFCRVLVLGTSKGLPPPKPLHATDEYVRSNYLRTSAMEMQVAEIVRSGNNISVRIRFSSGDVISKVVRGRDPRIFAIGDTTVEVIYWNFVTEPNPRNRAGSNLRAEVFAISNVALDAESALRFHTMIEMQLRGYEVSLFLRQDQWFIYESTYPYANPFLRAATIPENFVGQTMRCRRNASISVSCR